MKTIKPDLKTATIVAQRMIDEGIVGVVGHLNSGATIPASKVYFDNAIPQVSPSATAIKYTAQNFNTAYRVMTNDEQQGKSLRRLCGKSWEKSCDYWWPNRVWSGFSLRSGKSCESRFGAEVVAALNIRPIKLTPDFSAILTSIKSKSPDVVFFGGMDPQGAPIAKQMQQLGLKSPVIGRGWFTNT